MGKPENFPIIGDLNMSIENVYLHTLATAQFKCAKKFTHCYQSHVPLACIDHILTNEKSLFKFSKTFETGLSDLHKLISVTIKSSSFKNPPEKDLQTV